MWIIDWLINISTHFKIHHHTLLARVDWAFKDSYAFDSGVANVTLTRNEMNDFLIVIRHFWWYSYLQFFNHNTFNFVQN